MTVTRQLVIFFSIAFAFTWLVAAWMILAHARIEFSILANCGPPSRPLLLSAWLYNYSTLLGGPLFEEPGWQDGPEWDKAFDYLAGGNAQLLAGLRQRFITGPIDWNKIFAQHK